MQYVLKNEANRQSKVLVMLHGTGGDEYDMLPLATMLDVAAPVISVKGNVLENGMPRFFRRLAVGQFDEEDLVARTHELNAFVSAMVQKQSLEGEVIAVGYSNGANIAVSSLFHSADTFDHAILFHPMVPLRGVELPDLSGKHIFIGAGHGDPYASDAEINELEALLTEAGATVEIFWHNKGHSLTQEELAAAVQWYESL